MLNSLWTLGETQIIKTHRASSPDVGSKSNIVEINRTTTFLSTFGGAKAVSKSY